MNRMIEALEMEAEEDEEHEGLLKNGAEGKIGSTRAALNQQQTKNKTAGFYSPTARINTSTTTTNSITSTGGPSTSSRKMTILTAVLVFIIGLVLLYGIMYKVEEEVITNGGGSTVANEDVHEIDAGVTEPVPFEDQNTNETQKPVPEENEEDKDKENQESDKVVEEDDTAPTTKDDEPKDDTDTNTEKEGTPEPSTKGEGSDENLEAPNNTDEDGTNPKGEKEDISGDAEAPINITPAGGHLYSLVSKIDPDPDHIPIDDETRKELTEKWGKWKFFDGDEAERPTNDYCGEYPNRDIPGDKFPQDSWQMSAVFVNHIIDAADNLLSRAKDAIFAEYGHGKPLPPEQLSQRLKMFKVERLDTLDAVPEKFSPKKGDRGNGGWTSKRSWDGLVRRLLHAIITNDTFTVVLAGHSAAAGHGNHFHQSYMMQFHKVMYPVFRRLGVKLITRNMSQGGLGTLQNSMGMGSLYGQEIDVLMWDSGMTEQDFAHVDLFYRQAMLSGNRIPLFLGGRFEVLKYLHDEADADVGDVGTGMDGIPEVLDEEQAKTIPYAARYMKCSRDRQDLCKNVPDGMFCSKCWIDRPDISKDEHFNWIEDTPSGQVKWHPGWRQHQLQGRVLAFIMLEALQDAIQLYSDNTMGGQPLDEDWWHMTAYYDNIRTKALQLSGGECPKISKDLPSRLCTTPMQARSLFTPRYNPAETSLTTLIQPAEDGYIPKNVEKMEYEGPDVHNSCYDIPTGEVDVLAIISGRRRRLDETTTTLIAPQYKYDRSVYYANGTTTHYDSIQNHSHDNNLVETTPENPYESSITFSRSKALGPTTTTTSLESITAIASIPTKRYISRYLGDDAIVPGKGWIVVEEPPGLCDGAYDSICGRARWITCPLSGHHDHRGVLIGDEYAGWLVFHLPSVPNGLIMLKIATYMNKEMNWKTKWWNSVNGEEEAKKVGESETENKQSLRRNLVDNEKNYPAESIFEYAIDGKITSLNMEQFYAVIKKPQRVLQVITLLDDPTYKPNNGNVTEVAIRMRNCGRDCPLAVSHIYWA